MRFGKICLVFSLLIIFVLTGFCSGGSTQKPIYMVLYWHQHQPSYLDAEKGFLIGPWVRTHSTKDYFDMVNVVKGRPEVHLTFDLSSILLKQIQEYYVDRIGPFVDLKNNSIDAEGFLQQWRRKTDPWIDLILTDTEQLSDDDLDYLLNISGEQRWHCFTITEPIISRFPEYIALMPEGASSGSLQGTKQLSSFTIEDKRTAKFFHYLANFDPAFLLGRVELPNRDEDGNSVFVDLSDIVDYSDSGTPDDDSDDRFTLKKRITEADCRRILVDTYKVMASVIPAHGSDLYNPETGEGRLEVVTTPFTHPILPLLIDSDIMKENRPADPAPSRFAYPQDADLHVKRGLKLFREMFGSEAYGMWPAEGSVSKAALDMFAANGVEWVTTGPHNLAYSIGREHHQELTPRELGRFYAVETANGEKIAVNFRDLELSDYVAFNYADKPAAENVDAFFDYLERYRSVGGNEDVVVTVLLDGENAWEFFTKDNDATGFFDGLYTRLVEKYHSREIITVTPAEYIYGNEKRGVKPHPIDEMMVLEKFHPGSWFSPDFTTWIGEEEENLAWEYLLRMRDEVARQNIPLPELEDFSRKDDPYVKGWESVMAAEGSDWFWWYGSDQTAPGGGDKVFDQNFRLHLMSVYTFFREAGYDMPEPSLPVIITQESRLPVEDFTELPDMDGRVVEDAWMRNAGYFSDDEGGAQFSKNDMIKRVYYGKSDSHLYFGLQGEFSSLKMGDNFVVALGDKESPEKSINLSTIREKASITVSMTRSGSPVVNVRGIDIDSDDLNLSVSDSGIEFRLPIANVDDIEQYLFYMSGSGGNVIDAAPDNMPFYFSSTRIPQIKVVFECDATKVDVSEHIYISGSLDQIGAWIPNRISLNDSGENGDRTAGDDIWSGEFFFDLGAEVLYKYTNSGREGVWSPGEEFSVENRRIIVKDDTGQGEMTVRDIFGVLK